MNQEQINIFYEKVHYYFDYKETGELFWLRPKAQRIKVGDVVGCIDKKDGYRRVELDGKSYLVHRLVWFWFHKTWPPECIDHINGIRHDNRIENLREANHIENGQNKKKHKNNSSSYTGVSYNKRLKKWDANICFEWKQKYLGSYELKEDAVEAYNKAKIELHEFQPIVRENHYG